jgi:hypothetical protein
MAGRGGGLPLLLLLYKNSKKKNKENLNNVRR